MIGSLYALIAALSYAINTILVRRAVIKVSDATIGILISVPMGVPLFFIFLVFAGQLESLFSFSWQSYVWLSLAGIFHFAVGRALYYDCVQLVGANIASILRRTNILVAVVAGIILLHEPLSWQLSIGVVLIIAGITLAGLSPRTFRNADGHFTKIPLRAFVSGFGCGAAWGISPIFVKLGLQDSGFAIAGGCVSFLAATVVLSFSLMSRQRRSVATQLAGKAGGLFFVAGLLSFFANLARYIALGLAPASVVTPIVSTEPVFMLLLSFIFNRKMEIFTRQVIIGTVIVVLGTILLV